MEAGPTGNEHTHWRGEAFRKGGASKHTHFPGTQGTQHDQVSGYSIRGGFAHVQQAYVVALRRRMY